MRILLVSTRGGPREGSWAEIAARHADLLAKAGEELTWMHVRPPMQAAVEPPEGLRFLALESEAPPFRKVTARLGDLQAETELSRLVRSDPPDLLHLFGYGNTGSTSIAWLAGRLGVPSLISLDLAETLCHRGDLIDFEGAECRQQDDPGRCLQCCLTPSGPGLSPLQSKLAKGMCILGGLSPYPNLVSFMNRLDLVISGLGEASALLVENEEALQRLEELGVAKRFMQMAPASSADVETWRQLYRSCLEGNSLPS
ncbi:MAG: glycosyltransferase [Planctomycetota bacterium]|jgi:hypothetical protein